MEFNPYYEVTDMGKQVRRHIIFYGRVQGVGFRYRAYYAAKEYRLGGWVKNRYDGTVEMEVQGDEWNIGSLLDFLHKQDYIRIERVESEEIPLKPESRKFQILY